MDVDKGPKLPAFGIRELYDSNTGVLHITKAQYESTVKSYPNAALQYLDDDDDGEVITVGSGIELQQRLEEPVRLGQRNKRYGELYGRSRRGSVDDSMIHLFDIDKTEQNLVIWREHEAYSSKSLRGSPSPAPFIRDSWEDAVSDEEEPFAKAESVQSEPSTAKETTTEESNGDAMKSAPEPAYQTTGPTVSMHPGAAKEFLQDLDNVLTAACRGLESFGLADILDNTAKALQSVAQKARDADTTPVEGLLQGFKEVVTEFGKFGMDILENLENVPEPVQTPAHAEPAAEPQALEIEASHLSSRAAAKEERHEERKASKEARVAAKEQRREEKKARRLERLIQREERRITRKGKANEILQTDLDEEYYRTVSKVPTQTMVKPTVAEPAKQVSFAEDSPYPMSSSKASEPSSAPLIDVPSAATSNEVHAKAQAALDMPIHRHMPPASTSYMAYRNFPNRPSPALPIPAQANKTVPGSFSIMDLETSNADFTARYPPLMSLRRAKTISELNQKAAPANAEHSAETTIAALRRYPSIGQLEAQRRSADEPGKAQLLSMQADMLRLRERQKAEPVAHKYRAPSVEKDNTQTQVPSSTRVRQPLFPASMARPLPGSWPEARQDEIMSAAPSESSGTFFNRMAGPFASHPLPNRAVSPALSCRATGPPEDHYQPTSDLRRAQTVTASNPAARLTRPFDPMINAPRPRIPRDVNRTGPVPQRSFTVQHPRPNQTEAQSSTLWSSFPRQAQVPMSSRPQPAESSRAYQLPSQPPLWPITSTVNANSAPPREPRPMCSEPAFHRPAPTTVNSSGRTSPPLSSRTKVSECEEALRAMGYGNSDPIEANRLDMYAQAADGDIQEAIDMIEEDRQVAEQIRKKITNIRVL